MSAEVIGAVRLCRQGLHDLGDPGNRVGAGRCGPCKRVYDRSRRGGGRRVRTTPGGAEYRDGRARLTDAEVDYLLSIIPCMGCGVPPQRREEGMWTDHLAGCGVAAVREG